MASARIRTGLAALPDGRVLVVGGDNGSQTAATVEAYDPSTGKFGGLTDLPLGYSEPGATIGLPDGTVLIINGTDRQAQVYEPLTGHVRLGPSMSSVRSYATGVSLADGAPLIIGGRTSAPAGPTVALHRVRVDALSSQAKACTVAPSGSTVAHTEAGGGALTPGVGVGERSLHRSA